MSTHATQHRPIRVILLLALGGLLVWQIVIRSLAAHLAREAPAAALKLHPSDPTALLDLADAQLNGRDKAAEKLPPGSNEQRASGNGLPAPRSDDDRIAGWAEVALRAAAARLPLDRKLDSNKDAGEAASPLSGSERARIRAMAEAAVLQEPLNARALRILGQLAVAEGDEAQAAKLMRAAADRSLAESVAVYWMLQKSFALKDYATSLAYADTFLRKRPQLMVHAIPILAWIAESNDQAATSALEAVLAKNPPWRAAFFSDLRKRITDARTPLNLLLSLKGTDAPPTTWELKTYLDFLIEHKLYELAYYTWLQFLPANELGRIGFIANNGFDGPPSGLPFDWEISQGTGVTIDIAPRPGEAEGDALFVELGPGRADFRGVSQLLMLTPGSYQLKGIFKGDTRGRRGLQWSIRCADNRGSPIGEGPMFVGVARAWTKFEFTFSVPDSKCRAQVLKLALAARSASEQLVSGAVWYDDLQISRVDRPEPIEAQKVTPQ
jgi:hypothetical protein